MQKKFKNIHSISCTDILSNPKDDKRRIYYYDIVNNFSKEKNTFIVKLPEIGRPKKSNTIIDDSNEFVNGFKVVQTKNKEFAYVRESDNALLPYRYDIATNFNNYGYAMVAKNGGVSWIDKNFSYLNRDGNFVEEDGYFIGFNGVSEFIGNSCPLSRVYYNSFECEKNLYLQPDGKFKEFYEYDGKTRTTESKTAFFNFATEFDHEGYAKAAGNILFARGYYCSYENLIKLCEESEKRGIHICHADLSFREHFPEIIRKKIK